MATRTQTDSKGNTTEIPGRFKPVQSRIDGWFTVETGNQIIGEILDSFIVTGGFGPKRVYKVKITENTETKATDENGTDFVATVGQTIGVDEKGFLKALDSVAKGKEVFIRVKGKGKAKNGQSAPWLFDLGVAD